MDVVENLNKVRERLKQSPHQITLVAVSKFQPVEKIRAAFAAGQIIFAENYMQEALKKQSELSDLKINWHFIGKIQKNKIRQLVGNFSLIQSVDNMDQVQKISKVAFEKNIEQKILIEVNVANELTKGGVALDDIEDFYRKCLEIERVKVCGLMALPPFQISEEQSRQFLRQMKKTFDSLRNIAENKSFEHLSLGTSHDFEMAITEGSNMVRIGTEIFGSREEE